MQGFHLSQCPGIGVHFSDPALVRYARKNIEEGARQAGRDTSEIKLYQRLACAVSEDREQVRKEARGYASVAAGTIYSAIPQQDMPPELWEDLRLMKEQYNYQQHGSMDAMHAELITERILDAVAISGTPEEAIPRFIELVDLGIENFVLPIATRDPGAVIRTLAGP